MANNQMIAVFNGRQFQNIVLPISQDPIIYCAKHNFVLINIIGEINDYQDKVLKEIYPKQKERDTK